MLKIAVLIMLVLCCLESCEGMFGRAVAAGRAVRLHAHGRKARFIAPHFSASSLFGSDIRGDFPKHKSTYNYQFGSHGVKSAAVFDDTNKMAQVKAKWDTLKLEVLLPENLEKGIMSHNFVDKYAAKVSSLYVDAIDLWRKYPDNKIVEKTKEELLDLLHVIEKLQQNYHQLKNLIDFEKYMGPKSHLAIPSLRDHADYHKFCNMKDTKSRELLKYTLYFLPKYFDLN